MSRPQSRSESTQRRERAERRDVDAKDKPGPYRLASGRAKPRFTGEPQFLRCWMAVDNPRRLAADFRPSFVDLAQLRKREVARRSNDSQCPHSHLRFIRQPAQRQLRP